MLEECSADVIISDEVMPEVRGYEFLREAAASCPGNFRMMVPCNVGGGDMIEGINSGVIHLFLPKPWAKEQMLRAWERARAAVRAPKPRPDG